MQGMKRFAFALTVLLSAVGAVGCAAEPAEEAFASDDIAAAAVRAEWSSNDEIDLNVSGAFNWGQSVNNDAARLDSMKSLVKRVKELSGTKKIRRLQITAHAGPGYFYLGDVIYYPHTGALAEFANLRPYFSTGGYVNLISCSAGFGPEGHRLGTTLAKLLPGIDVKLGLAFQTALRTGPVGEFDYDGGARTFRLLDNGRYRLTDHWKTGWSSKWWTEKSAQFYAKNDAASELMSIFALLEAYDGLDLVDMDKIVKTKTARTLALATSFMHPNDETELAKAVADIFSTRQYVEIIDAFEDGVIYTGRYGRAITLMRNAMTPAERGTFVKQLRASYRLLVKTVDIR